MAVPGRYMPGAHQRSHTIEGSMQGDTMKQAALFLALAAAAALPAHAMAGCSKEAPKTEAKKADAGKAASALAAEVKIGHVGPLTGGIAHLGKDNENGARLAVEEANAAGIKIDGKEVKFTFVAEDD